MHRRYNCHQIQESFHDSFLEPNGMHFGNSNLEPTNLSNCYYFHFNTYKIRNQNTNVIVNSKNIDSCNMIESKSKSSKDFSSKNVNQPKSLSRVHWTKEEDEKLRKLVELHGTKKWKHIAELLKTKNGKQCRDHYKNVLDPEIKNSLWTAEEERTLILKYEQFGPCWSKIKIFLPGRTSGMIKNYINMLIKQKGSDIFNNYKESSQKMIDFNSKNYEFQNSVFIPPDINYLLNRKTLATINDDACDLKTKELEGKNNISFQDISYFLNRPSKFSYTI